MLLSYREIIRVIPNSEEEPYDQFEITMVDDVSTWNAGDKLVIASTDFSMSQAEEVEVVSADGNNLIIKGSISHYKYVKNRFIIAIYSKSTRIYLTHYIIYF